MKPTVAGSKLLKQARNRLYTGNLRYAIRRLGLNEPLSDLYWKLVFALADDTQTHSIAGQTVSFHTETLDEFIRFEGFMGEKQILKDVVQSVGTADRFYDIGANVGTYTCFVASKLGSGTVTAFEPEPRNVKKLKRNLEQNGLDAQVVEVALSDTNGSIELALAEGDAGEGEHAIAAGESQATIEVKTKRVDTIVQEDWIEPPTVVKIDVEGAELSVLRGMKETLQKHCRMVYVELHTNKIERYSGTVDEVYSLLGDAGFEIEVIERRGSQHFIKAVE